MTASSSRIALVLTRLFVIRGSYRGGPIDISGGKGIKFDN